MSDADNDKKGNYSLMSSALMVKRVSSFRVMASSHATTQKLFNAIPQANENGCKTTNKILCIDKQRPPNLSFVKKLELWHMH